MSSRRRAERAATAAVEAGLRVVERRRERERLVTLLGDAPRRPWIYLPRHQPGEQLAHGDGLELAHALLARSLFPDAPLKWMPPTRHMTGDIFRGYLLDGFFTLAGALTGQGILLVGMMTEAVVTPWLSDRDLALRNVRYVLDAAGGLVEDFHPAPDGFIARRAHAVLAEAVALLGRIADPDQHPNGLLDAIADGTFGLMKRPADGGRGLDGTVRTDPEYVNPARTLLERWVAQRQEQEGVA